LFIPEKLIMHKTTRELKRRRVRKIT